jgi:VCBS repeat-containing protein
MQTAVNPLQNLVRRFVPLVFLWLVLGSLAACGGGGGSDGGSAAVAQPPVASDGSVTASEDSTVNASLSASDPNGLTLTFRVVTNPGKGTAVINATTGSFTYTPDLNANGGDSFTFVANNGDSDSNTATITITITPVNDPPGAVNDTYFVPYGPGQTYTVTANCADPNPNKRGVLCNDTDPDNTVPTNAFIASSPSHGTLTLNQDGSFTYTHNGTSWSTCGSLRCDSFTYFANDGTLNSNTPTTVTLYINQQPVANNACASTPEGTPIGNGTLTGTDPDNQSLTYALETNGAKGDAVVFANGSFTYTPKTNLPSGDGKARGMDRFTFRVTDTFNQSAIGTVTVLIDDPATLASGPGRVRIMPLGDSITDGYPGDNSAESLWVGYRRKLYNDVSALNSTQFGVDFIGSVTNTGASAIPPLADRDHEGHDGWCDDNNPACSVSGGANIADSVIGFLSSNPADVILLHIGTNHFSTSNSGVNTILNNINTWAQSNYPVTVFVARIIPSVNGSLNVNTFNNNVATIATDRSFVKVYTVNQQGTIQLSGQPNNADPALMGDNLHPNQTGYDMMADTWKASLISSGVLPSCP